MYDGKLTDKNAKLELGQQLKSHLRTVDKCFLTGRQKIFTYQHTLLPRILWPIIIYDVVISWVEKYEGSINVFAKMARC